MGKASETASNTVLRATLEQNEARRLWRMQTTVVRWVNRATVEALSRDRGRQRTQDRGARQGNPPRMS
jgi:hypothetical protein